MKDEIKQELITKAENHAKAYTYARPNNPIELIELTPSSGTTAYGIYHQIVNNKIQLVYFYYSAGDFKWHFYVPTTDQVLGMRNFSEAYLKIEKYNFKKGKI